MTLTEICEPQEGGYNDDTKAVPHDPTAVHLERRGKFISAGYIDPLGLTMRPSVICCTTMVTTAAKYHNTCDAFPNTAATGSPGYVRSTSHIL